MHTSYAETMSGATYTLNGSISTINGQGQGGVYTLNSSGNSITIENSSGGIYSLYPTPYGTNPAVSSSGGQTSLGAVIAGIIYGGESGLMSTTSPSNTNTGTNTNRPGGVKTVDNIGYDPTTDTTYRDYAYSDYVDTVNFGKTNLNTGGDTEPQLYNNWLLIKIITIGLLLILLKVWHQYRKSL